MREMAFFRFEEGQWTKDRVIDATFGLMQRLEVVDSLSE
jgi:hypothetical protein